MKICAASSGHLHPANAAPRKRESRRAQGQSIAEVAIVMPLLLLLLLGGVEIGRLAYYSIEVSNAARAGVQYGSQSLADSADNAGILQAAQNDASNIAGLTVTTRNLCACSNDPANYVGCPAKGCGTGHSVVFLEVRTEGNVQPLFHIPGLPNVFQVTGQALMRVTQ